VSTEPSPDASALVAELLSDGELLMAYDLADSVAGGAVGLERIHLDHLAVLALARMGATDRAESEFARRGLREAALDPLLPAALAEDLAAVDARLAKDRALAGPAPDPRQCAEAARRYELIFHRLGRPYTCINAATLWLLAGDSLRAEGLATAAAQLVEGASDYWGLATLAESQLVLGDASSAGLTLAAARNAPGAGLSARASTGRQLRLVGDLLGFDRSVLDPLGLPSVVTYCGHRSGGRPQRWSVDDEASITSPVDELLAGRAVGIGVGGLASGADIVIAERLVAAGAELHVVLPFDADQCVTESVAPGGPQWVPRFHACIEAAATTRVILHTDAADDPLLFGHGSAVAMGDAVIRADQLGVPVVQLGVWDGVDRPGPAGTSADVRRWSASGREHVTIRLPDAGGPSGEAGDPDGHPASVSRRVCGILFADFRGYSRLSDRLTVTFVDRVLSEVADELARFSAEVLHTNRWGDGLHLITGDVVACAELALSLQERLGEIDLAAVGLPDDLGLRIGLHAAPVFAGSDPVLGGPTFFGADVTRTARIEPRTPEGEVYVSDDFAAIVALDAADKFRCDYVGRLPAEKDFGAFPMYLLRRRASATPMSADS